MPPRRTDTRTDTPAAERRVFDAQGRKSDARVARIAERDWGILSVEELEACGLTERAILERCRAGRLHRRHQGVYAVGHDNVTLQGRFMAAVKAGGPGALLSHVSAAALQGAFIWDHRRVEITVTTQHTRDHTGVHAHRTRFFDPRDHTAIQGIPVTSPARTALDCAAVLDDGGLRRTVREMQSRGLVTVGELAEVLIRLGPRRGSRKLARIISTGPAPTRSVLEDAVLDLMLRGGLRHPEVNEPLILDGCRVVPDFRWPAQRLVVEADGAAWHDHKLAREDDAERQALLEAHGDRVVRVTWDQAIERPAQTLARIRAAEAPPA